MDVTSISYIMRTIQSAVKCAQEGGHLGGHFLSCRSNKLTWFDHYSFQWEAIYEDGSHDFFKITTNQRDLITIKGNFLAPDPKNPEQSREFNIRDSQKVQEYLQAMNLAFPTGADRQNYFFDQN